MIDNNLKNTHEPMALHWVERTGKSSANAY